MTTPIESRAAAYIAKMPPAVAGQAGHRATFAVACRLREFNLPFERAEILLAQWNQTHCQPKWTAAALRHKLVDAFHHTTPRPEYVAGASRGIVTPRSQTSPAPSRPCVTDQAKAEAKQLASFIKALLDQGHGRPAPAPESTVQAIGKTIGHSIKTLREQRSIGTLAELRGISRTAVQSAHFRGLIRFDNYRFKEAWFVLDRSLRVASARRMDGHSWFEGTSTECKSLMLPASQAKWPIGIREAEDYPNILLCEGAPDLLAAFHVTLGRSNEFAPVAMLSASCPIHTDALRLFKGKRVRILEHSDQAGRQAAKKWTSQIRGHVTALDVFSFAPYGVKDLNEYVRGKFPAEKLLQ